MELKTTVRLINEYEGVCYDFTEVVHRCVYECGLSVRESARLFSILFNANRVIRLSENWPSDVKLNVGGES